VGIRTLVGLLALGSAAVAGIRYGMERAPAEGYSAGALHHTRARRPVVRERETFPHDTGDRVLSPAEDSEVYEHYRAGLELLESKNPAQALVRLRKAGSAQPGKSSIHEALGRAYFALGLWMDAEREFRTIVEIRPSDDYAHYCLSRALAKSGRTAEARTHLRLARALRPEHPHYTTQIL
jgi:Flp pilus assembly protein TadD